MQERVVTGKTTGPREDSRGNLLDYTTQLWVKATGKVIDLDDVPWLQGPVGGTDTIGTDFFETYAHARGLTVRSSRGLLPDFGVLNGSRCRTAEILPSVARFYERTADYEVEVWSEWCGAFRPFGAMLVALFSKRLQQLNMPLSPLDTSRGLTSLVCEIADSPTADSLYAGWIRHVTSTRRVLYVGAYSSCRVPGFDGACVKVVFPLPNGNATIILYPVSGEDGSLLLVSSGSCFGDPGFYFIVNHGGRLWAKYVRAMRETIRVYADKNDVRTDHNLKFFGATFLRLHYRLRKIGE